jgi:glycosyltransferase involved in cell wall biosynthesis
LKVLFLTPQLPYPSNSGGKIKSFKMIQFLGEHYDLDLGFLVKKDQISSISDFISQVKVGETYSKVLDRPRSIINFVKSLFYHKPLSVYRNFSPDFYTEISKKIYKYDLVIVDHFLMYQYIPKDYKGKVILHQHNAEFIMWKRYAELTNNIIKKLVLNYESNRIQKYESKICNKSDVVLAASNDIEHLSKISTSAKFSETHHLGDDQLLKFFHPGFNHSHDQITYVGSLDWQPNEDGLRWFIENVWQDILYKRPDAELKIIGKGASSDFESFCHRYEKINLLGFVESLEEELSQTRVLIAPLRFGSGMKVKTINSLYTGIPLVTTTVGAEGIDIIDKLHFCKADTAQEQIESILKLMEDKDYWEHIGGEARELSKLNYTWKNNLKNLKEVVDGCNKVCEHSIQSTEQKIAA